MKTINGNTVKDLKNVTAITFDGEAVTDAAEIIEAMASIDDADNFEKTASYQNDIYTLVSDECRVSIYVQTYFGEESTDDHTWMH